jgi:hypothetical protein
LELPRSSSPSRQSWGVISSDRRQIREQRHPYRHPRMVRPRTWRLQLSRRVVPNLKAIEPGSRTTHDTVCFWQASDCSQARRLPTKLTPFSERHLCSIDPLTGRLRRRRIVFRLLDRPAGVHQRCNEGLPFIVCKGRIAYSPNPAPHDHVTAIRSSRKRMRLRQSRSRICDRCSLSKPRELFAASTSLSRTQTFPSRSSRRRMLAAARSR